MIISRLTADMLVDMPVEVRTALGLTVGDLVGYELDGQRVMMQRIDHPLDEDGVPDMFVGNLTAFTEWADDHDRMYDLLRDR